MHVVATAGHVDHGKSTLVRALTGQEPDRLATERVRGLSIELGYVWTTLSASGAVAFVDVPGHERFLTTALAGLGPVPVAMFVVAADDPWMPQAAEHLAALDALGVRHGLLVVTRADLADPEPALARARAELGRTSLAGCPAVVVSGRTGDGLDRLRMVLDEVLQSVPTPDPAGDVRYWIDRAFTVSGAGLVVTGTLGGGTVRVGDELLADGRPVRVRGLESLGQAVEHVAGVARVAMRLGGHAGPDLRRGTVLATPGAFEWSDVVDVELRGEGSPPERPMLHLGSAATAVRARALGDRWARLRLPRPLPWRLGDRALLRDPGSRALWGVAVRDVQPPPLAGRGAAGRRAAVLSGLDGSAASVVAAHGVVRRSTLARLGAGGPLPEPVVGDWLVAPELVTRWRRGLAEAATGDEGLPVGEAVRLLGLPDVALLDIVVTPPLAIRAGRVLAGSGVPAALEAAMQEIRAELAAAPFRAPDAERLAALGLGPREVAVLAREGAVLSVGSGVVLLPGADTRAAEVLARLPQPFTVSEARQALETSRRVVLPLLAHLDKERLTTRLPDDRRVVRSATNERPED